MAESEPTAEHTNEEKVLYDLFVPHEWPEVVNVLPAEESHSLWRALANLAKACFRFAVTKISSFGGTPAPPTALISLINNQLPWQLAITNDGRLLAVVKEEEVEIRSIEDDFEVSSATCKVERDPRAQWRKVVWNEDGTLLAVGTSYGAVSVATPTGRCICRIPGKAPPTDVTDKASLPHAVAGLAFLPPPKTEQEEERCLTLLVVLHYGGTLDTYQLRSLGAPVFLHSFSFREYYPGGVGCLLYHCGHSTLIVGSCSQDAGSLPCVSGWRLLDGAPYWAPRLGQELRKKPKRLFGRLQKSASGSNRLVFQLSVSPSGSLLASLDITGRLCLWELPSLRLRRAWSIEEQPHSEESDILPSFGSSSHKTRGPPLLLDVSWWSEEALILVTTAGEVTVSSVLSLKNLLGDSPEPGACITTAHNGQFFLLECDVRSSTVGRFHLPSLSEESDHEEEEEGESSLSGISINLLKQVLYFLTESESFRPSWKKSKVVARKYRLACLRSMPPEECYERKMQREEYGEALLLARQFGLDCDLVYQRQWQNNPVSVATIQDYLSKVSKRSWVLQECLSRVPEEYDATRELLQFGLGKASFRELKEAGLEEGDSPVAMETLEEWEWEQSTKQIEKEIGKWKKLSPEQVSICQYRHMLFTFLDRLATYEVILGGPSAADEHFDGEFFREFRSSNLVKMAVNFARDSDWRALEALFTYHGESVLPHRLVILSNFPETTPPQSYQSILPTPISDGGMESWELDQHREPDWVETNASRQRCSLPIEAHSNSGSFLYEENPEWQKYEDPSSGDVLREWYVERATEIEEFSGQVDSALSLVLLGVERGVEGLERLHHEMLTLHTLVYQCNVDSRLSLRRLQTMSNLEILQLMMKESEDKRFILDFCQRAVPFLDRVERLCGGGEEGGRRRQLEEFLTTVSKDDLAPCLAIFQQSKGKGPAAAYGPVVKDTNQLMSLALQCIYACGRSDQLEVADKIVECLPLSTTDPSQQLAELHRQVDKLEDHLSASDILKTYGVYKPIHYIRDVQDSAEEAEQLMVKLTRVASRQQAPPAESSWRNLLQHLLSLRSRVFTSLDQATCYKVFTESLLCSGSEAGIHFAAQALTLTPSPPTTKPHPSITSTQQGLTYQLPYETSLQLVVKATQEYFNSASSLMDRDMDLARSCLALFPRPLPRAVQSELNLIASLALLDDFGVSMLPIQVRLCENKLDIIRMTLEASHSAYKKYEKILRLAYLLGLDEEGESYSEGGVVSGRGLKISDGRGHTLILVALTTIEKSDFKVANVLCSRLMEARFSPAWEVCRLLALQEQFHDVGVKLNLLNFSLTHCPPEEIGSILRERRGVEVQGLCLQYQGGAVSPTGPSGSVHHLVGRGVQIVSRSAGAVQHLMRQRTTDSNEQSSTKSLEKVILDCVTLLGSASDRSYSERESVQLKLAYHPFYDPLLPLDRTREEGNSRVYGKFSYGALRPLSPNPQLALNQALLRALMVASSLSEEREEEDKQQYSQALLRLAEESAQTDTHLLLGYLLSLSEPGDVDKLLSKLIPEKVSLQLAIYCICLQLYVAASVDEPATAPHPYPHPPLKLVDHVTSHVTSTKKSDWLEHCQPLVELFHRYRELLADHTQAEILQGLGLGIDVQQFTRDAGYKHSTVLSLARTSNPAVFHTALSLAHRHVIPEWEVHVALLDWLFTDSRLNPQEIQQRLAETKTVGVLLQEPQQTANSLQSHTYLRLPGNKYGLLLLYYSLLQQCTEHGASVKEPVSIDTHIKLLKRFKSSLPAMDYKALMSGEDTLTVLTPVLSPSNIHVVAKLASKIPHKDGYLTPGMVFCAFAEKLFWVGDGRQQQPRATSDWLHRYEACHEYLKRLGPEDFHHFVSRVALSPKAHNQLTRETRAELVKRATKFSRQQAKSGPEREGGDRSMSYDGVAQHLQKCLQHLRNLGSSELTLPLSVTEETWEQFEREFDLSLSQPDKIHTLAVHMAERGIPLGAVHSLLALAKTVYSNSFTVQQIVREALLANLSQEEGGLERCEGVISAVSQHESEGGTLVSSSDVLGVLRPYCSDSSHPADTRRTLLQLMERYLYLSQEDTNLLLLYQTRSILAPHFTIEVSAEEVSSPEAQQQLFFSLLKEATSLEHLLALATLLEAWPESSSLLRSCWVDLLQTLAAQQERGPSCVPALRAGLPTLPQEVDEQLYAVLSASSFAEAFKLALVSSNQVLLEKAFEHLKQESQLRFDADLFELLIVQEKVADIATTSLYTALCSYLKNPEESRSINAKLFAKLLNCSKSEVCEKLGLSSPAERVKRVSRQLCAAGLVVEAGALLVSSQFFHPGLQTVGSALATISQCLREELKSVSL